MDTLPGALFERSSILCQPMPYLGGAVQQLLRLPQQLFRLPRQDPVVHISLLHVVTVVAGNLKNSSCRPPLANFLEDQAALLGFQSMAQDHETNAAICPVRGKINHSAVSRGGACLLEYQRSASQQLNVLANGQDRFHNTSNCNQTCREVRTFPRNSTRARNRGGSPPTGRVKPLVIRNERRRIPDNEPCLTRLQWLGL